MSAKAGPGRARLERGARIYECDTLRAIIDVRSDWVSKCCAAPRYEDTRRSAHRCRNGDRNRTFQSVFVNVH